MVTAGTTDSGDTEGLGQGFVVSLEPRSGTEITWNFFRSDGGPVAGEYTCVGGPPGRCHQHGRVNYLEHRAAADHGCRR